MAKDTQVQIDPYLGRLAAKKSSESGRDVEAAQIGGDPPFFFAARELLVGERERDLLERWSAAGAELVPPAPIPPQPPEVARTRHPRSVEAPRHVIVRLDPGEADDEAKSALGHFATARKGDFPAAGIRLSSEKALALAARAIILRKEGRRVALNYLNEPCTLPLRAPTEDSAHPQGPNVATWPWLNDPVRIVDAWQLFESYRANGPTPSLIWIAICDNGFWTDNAGVPIPVDLANCSPMLNLASSGQPIGGSGQAGALWHGTWVASCAVGIVDNGTEVAGSGGTIAHGALFRTNYFDNEILDCLTTATAWGLDIVNFSLRRIGGFDDDDEEDHYNDTFQWAADNGTIIIVASGNDRLEMPRTEVRPASLTPGVITVGNVDPATWAANPSSNFGSAVHLWAPGTNIVSAPDPTSTFPVVTGSSFSAPFVAGVVAMMLAVRPNMRVEEIRTILQDSGWTGSDGKVTRGLDAYEALKKTIQGRIPDEFEEWAGGGNNSESNAALLAPVAGNTNRLGPIGGTASHNPGDQDWWRFTLIKIQTVTIRLEWYERLTTLNLETEAADEGVGSVDSLVETSPGPGVTVLSGVLGPGTYRLCVTGGAATAYEIGVRLARASIQPDQFEPNNSFEDAAAILLHSSQRVKYAMLGFPWWGPGSFDGTLNWRSYGFGAFMTTYMDSDFFLLDARVEKPLQERFCDIDHIDEPIDILLYDRNRAPIAEWLGRRQPLSIKLDEPEVHYLELRANKPTRYRISTYMMVDPDILPDEIEQAEVLPDWWGKSPFVKVEDHPNFHYVSIGDGADDIDPNIEAALRFRDVSRQIEIALVDAKGATLRQSEPEGVDGSIRTLSLEALEPGGYFVRIAPGPQRLSGRPRSIELLPTLRAAPLSAEVSSVISDPCETPERNLVHSGIPSDGLD